jgi:ribose 5-phosphate isomerase B
MKIAISTDHAGYEQLKDLEVFIKSLGHECQNFGPTKLSPDDDYPDFIAPAAKAVASGECDKGIILGASGQGEAMAANRIDGVRCAVFYGPVVPKGIVDISGRVSSDPYEIIRLSRLHNDANVLSLAARFVALSDMKNVIKLWLETPFSGDERHARRIKKLDKEN